jgi:hypothetical protein
MIQMDRKISFSESGTIVVEGETSIDYIEFGVVLLTLRQATEATRYGWENLGSTNEQERELGLVRVQRGEVLAIQQRTKATNPSP